ANLENVVVETAIGFPNRFAVGGHVLSLVRWRLVTRRGGRLAHPPKHLVPDLLPPALHLRSRLQLPRVLVLHRGVVVVAVSGPEVGLAELGEVVHGWLLAWVWRSMGAIVPHLVGVVNH